MVSGKWLSMVLNEMGLQDKFNTSLFVAEVEVLISKLFSRVTDNICIEESVELTLNWALNCYDNGRTGRVLLRSLATGIIILSALTPLEKYDGLYKIITSTENETISEDNLSTLLLDILMLIEFVSEEKVYSSEDIPGAVLSCKQLLNTEIINEAGFINWAKREPQILTWLPTFHRLVTSESIKHEAKCAVCKMCPIVGFRYRCQKCFNIDICQNCYWLQCGTKTHKITHPVKEYCLATTSSDDMKDFASQLRNKITRRYHRHKPKKPYLSSAEFLQDKTNVKSNKQIHDRIATLASKLSNEEVEKPLIIPTKNEISSHEDVKKIQQIEAEKEQYLKKIADLQAENRILSEEATHAKFITPITVHHHAEAAPTSVASMTSDTGAYKSSLPASTAATCISLTGLSASTLDDWPFTQGNEEENLQQMTTQLVNIIAEPSMLLCQ
jgi:dystrophin